MGREIRRVPANWQHPQENGKYNPLFDKDFDTALQEWLTEYEAWKKDPGDELFTETPPNPERYRPKFENAEWYQVYETVSEGTPVTPPFAIKAEIIDYLSTHGDFWDQKRGDGAWSRQAAECFAEAEWVPSGVLPEVRSCVRETGHNTACGGCGVGGGLNGRVTHPAPLNTK